MDEGTSPAQRDDYIIAQYAGGGTTTTTYYRRKLSNVFAALNSSDITTALGFTPTANTGTITGVSVNGTSVATSGVANITSIPYSILTGTPTIPTVNNGTLTIQKNGTNVQTFTANQSSNVTANITVPVNFSDLGNRGEAFLS